MGERRGGEERIRVSLVVSLSLSLSLSHIGRRRSRGEVTTVFEARKPNRDKGVGLDMDRCILHGRSPVYSSLTNRQPRVPAWPGTHGPWACCTLVWNLVWIGLEDDEGRSGGRAMLGCGCWHGGIDYSEEGREIIFAINKTEVLVEYTLHASFYHLLSFGGGGVSR